MPNFNSGGVLTAALADPLISGMAIARILPVHESSRRLRRLAPESPRVHGVAVMSDVGRRRWWPLATAVPSGRLRHMFDVAAGELGDRRAAARQRRRRSPTASSAGW